MDDGSNEAIASPTELQRLVERGKTVTRATFLSAALLTLAFVLLV
jgi:hypothetical protein